MKIEPLYNKIDISRPPLYKNALAQARAGRARERERESNLLVLFIIVRPMVIPPPASETTRGPESKVHPSMRHAESPPLFCSLLTPVSLHQ